MTKNTKTRSQLATKNAKFAVAIIAIQLSRLHL